MSNISGVARPTLALRRELGLLNVKNLTLKQQIEALLNHFEAVDVFATVLTQCIERNQDSSGYADMRKVAADVLTMLGAHQK